MLRTVFCQPSPDQKHCQGPWRSWGSLKAAQSCSTSLQISSALAKGTDVDFSFNPAVSRLERSKASAFHAKFIHHSFSSIAGGLSPSMHTHPSRDRGGQPPPRCRRQAAFTTPFLLPTGKAAGVDTLRVACLRP